MTPKSYPNRIIAPAHPYATDTVVYTAWFNCVSKFVFENGTKCEKILESKKTCLDRNASFLPGMGQWHPHRLAVKNIRLDYHLNVLNMGW